MLDQIRSYRRVLGPRPFSAWERLQLDWCCVKKVARRVLPMDDADKQAPERYRDAAERLRDLAEQTPLPDIQADLMSLAAYFDRMAAHLEAQRRPAVPSERGNT